jgi:hypothetical protein
MTYLAILKLSLLLAVLPLQAPPTGCAPQPHRSLPRLWKEPSFAQALRRLRPWREHVWC